MVTGLSIGITASAFQVAADVEVIKNPGAFPGFVGGAYGGSASVDNSDVASSENKWTLSFWTRRDSTATGDQYVCQFYRGSGGSGNKLLVRFESNGDFELYIVSGFKYLINFPEMHRTSGDNDWHHVMISNDADASTYQFYFDGVDVTPTTASPTGLDLTTIGGLGIGSTFTGAGAQSTNGGNAQIALWLGTAYDLDDTDVRKKFYNAGPVDMGVDGTRTGLAQPNFYFYGNSSTADEDRGTNSISFTRSYTTSPAWGDAYVNPNDAFTQINHEGNAQLDTAQKQFGDSSAIFDGSGDYLTTPVIELAGDYTVECWFRANNVSGSKALVGGDDTSPYEAFSINNNDVYWNSPFIQFTSDIVANTWYHIAVTRSGSTVRLFADGVLQGSGTSSSTVFAESGNTELRIGRDAFTSYFNGYIDEFRISNSARYTTGFTPTTTAFTHDSNTLFLTHFDDPTDGATNFVTDEGNE